MSRQSISFTPPDDERLNTQVDWIRAKLEKAENSGFTNDSKDQILKQSKSAFHNNE
jgi:antitoxin ParD1/3/4